MGDEYDQNTLDICMKLSNNKLIIVFRDLIINTSAMNMSEQLSISLEDESFEYTPKWYCWILKVDCL